jgi:hypothetical protein
MPDQIMSHSDIGRDTFLGNPTHLLANPHSSSPPPH